MWGKTEKKTNLQVKQLYMCPKYDEFFLEETRQTLGFFYIGQIIGTLDKQH
jgi:hypothetical protein